MYATAECTLKEVKASRLDLEYTLKEVSVRSTIDHLHRSPSEPPCVFFLFSFITYIFAIQPGESFSYAYTSIIVFACRVTFAADSVKTLFAVP